MFKERKNVGRQTDYTDALGETICAMIADGMSLRKICQPAHMPDRQTVRRWLDAFPHFAAIHARARQAQADAMDDKILDVADKVTAATAQAARVKIEAYKWRAERLAPKRYGAKQEVDITLTATLSDLIAESYKKAPGEPTT